MLNESYRISGSNFIGQSGYIGDRHRISRSSGDFPAGEIYAVDRVESGRTEDPGLLRKGSVVSENEDKEDEKSIKTDFVDLFLVSGGTSTDLARALMPGTFGPAMKEAFSQMLSRRDDLPDNLHLNNFRTCKDEFEPGSGELPCREGLEDLKMSGSSQFTRQGLEEIRKRIPEGNLYVVDLREESHGIHDTGAISWRGVNNWGNLGRDLDYIISEERGKLAEYNAENSGSAVPEDQVCREAGVGYVRIPVTDHMHPEDRDVDQFLEMEKSLPEGTHLHFHCKFGRGRTTTFMIMHDIFHNAKKVGIEDIVKRQRLLGGSNLFADEKAYVKKEIKDNRADFVRNFHEYCRTNEDNFATSWTEWISKRR